MIALGVGNSEFRAAHARRRTALHDALTAVLIDVDVVDPEAAHVVLADVRNLDRILTAIYNADDTEGTES